MKKYMSMFLAISLAFTLCACGSKDKDDIEEDETVETSKDDGAFIDKEKEQEQKEKEEKERQEQERKEQERKEQEQREKEEREQQEREEIPDYSYQEEDVPDTPSKPIVQPQQKGTLVETEGPYEDVNEALNRGNAYVGEVRVNNGAKGSYFEVIRDPSGNWIIQYYIYS